MTTDVENGDDRRTSPQDKSPEKPNWTKRAYMTPIINIVVNGKIKKKKSLNQEEKEYFLYSYFI